MSVKVRIPLKNGTEITTEGELDYVKSTISKIGELFEILETAIGDITVGRVPPVLSLLRWFPSFFMCLSHSVVHVCLFYGHDHRGMWEQIPLPPTYLSHATKVLVM